MSVHYTDPQPVSWGLKTFQCNLITGKFYEWPEPNRNATTGNETATEADNQKLARWAYFPDKLNNNHRLNNGDQIDLSGENAAYVKKMYVSNPPSPYDLLTIVSES